MERTLGHRSPLAVKRHKAVGGAVQPHARGLGTVLQDLALVGVVIDHQGPASVQLGGVGWGGAAAAGGRRPTTAA